MVKENKLCLAFVKYLWFWKYTAFYTSAQFPNEKLSYDFQAQAEIMCL